MGGALPIRGARVTLPAVTTPSRASRPQRAETVDSTAPSRSPLLVLAASLLGISFAAPLVRLSHAPALVIAAWRLGFSLVIVAIALVIGGEWRAWRTLARRDVALAVGAGVLLSLHFWSWNASLRYTSVAASVALVNLQPVVIALFSARWLGEHASRKQWYGIALAVFGALVVGLADVPGGVSGLFEAFTAGAIDNHAKGASVARVRSLFGDVLACVGAVTGAFYFLIGRRIRQTLALWPYVGLVYGAAFLACVFFATVTGASLSPQPPRELAIFAGLALGPMLLGHTGMIWALGHLPAYVVNLTTLGEPIGATLLAAVLPGIAEVPGIGTIVGSALVLTGVMFAARR